MSLEGKIVVVTGGTSGIGLDMARRFLEQGAHVLINGSSPQRAHTAQRELEPLGELAVVVGDVSDGETADAIAVRARERWGGVDVLVNCAGIFGVKPFLETSAEELERFFAVNVLGTFQVTQAIVPLMIERGGGAVINLGSVLVEQARTGLAVSGAMASKGGVHALTVSLAAELAEHKIRVSTLAPGIIRTPLIGPDADSMASWHPLGRVGEVSDTTAAALYLAEATFVSGSVLNVDGGYASGR